MLFGYLTLFTALIISLSAAVYSILGLTAIFAAAFWPVVIMGGSLEFGKIVTTLWLHKYWDRAELQYKLYLCSAVAILMLLTSMGVFGFLSKAHTDQSLVSGDVTSKIAIYDEKIKIARDNIDANRKALTQMDAAVDQVMSRSSDEKGADKSVAIRRSQATERNRLLKEIDAEQKKITALNDEAAPIRAEVRKVEAEVGPIKYIAALIYGDNPDANILEKSVRWVIILIVIVFDPLALTLLLAATKALEWERGINIFAPKNRNKEDELENNEPPVSGDIPVFDQREEIPLGEPEEPDEPEKNSRWGGFGFPMSSQFSQPEDPVVEEPVVEDTPIETTPPVPSMIVTAQGKDYVEVNGKRMHHLAFDSSSSDAQNAVEKHQGLTESKPRSELEADNMPLISRTVTGFGSAFPVAANKGDMYLRVDYLPNRLFKYNGFKWIELDKKLSDTYVYDDAYIDHLIEKISTGEYDTELLSDTERDRIEQRLNNNNA